MLGKRCQIPDVTQSQEEKEVKLKIAFTFKVVEVRLLHMNVKIEQIVLFKTMIEVFWISSFL